MALRLATALFRSQDATQQDLQLASSLTAFFFRYGERILESPKQRETAPSQCQCAHCHSVLEVKCIVLLYCSCVLYSCIVLVFCTHALYSCIVHVHCSCVLFLDGIVMSV